MLAFYRARGCPCAYPRFMQLAGFNFRKFGVGPVGSHLQQILINLACFGEGAFYEKKSEEGGGVVLACGVCGTRVQVVDEEFSINMRFNRLEFEGRVLARIRGLPLEKIPVPEQGGFFGFGAEDIRKCREGFTRPGTFEELGAYLKGGVFW